MSDPDSKLMDALGKRLVLLAMTIFWAPLVYALLITLGPRWQWPIAILVMLIYALLLFAVIAVAFDIARIWAARKRRQN